jgi:hypothetical protein
MDTLIEQLKSIPFLELDIDIDLNKLIGEYNLLKTTYSFESYNTNFWQVRRKYRNAWSGISLISSDGSLYKDMYEDSTHQDNFQKTELKSLVPYMYEICGTISGNQLDSRARVMRIAPKKSLVWHSHVLEHGQAEWQLTIQIPIVMPEKFEYCVVDSSEFKWWKRFHRPNWFKNIFRKKLEVGKAYYFNSYHYHNVYNYSNEYRATIMLYIDLRNEKVRDLVKRSLNKK